MPFPSFATRPGSRLARRGWTNRVGVFALLLGLCGRAAAFDLPPGEPDPLTGKEINGVCAGCHGDNGQGGKDGEYPRVAGLPVAYIFRQVKLFQQNMRPNLPMLEHVHERQMSDVEIRDIAVFLEAIDLPTRIEPMAEDDPRFDAYERMLATQRVVQIPAYPGDEEAGRRRYGKECKSCHGADGQGDTAKGVPRLVGQYIPYLWRQMDKFRDGRRVHDPDDPEDDSLSEYSRQELDDMFAYLSRLDD